MSIQHIVSHNIDLPIQVRFTPVKRKWTLREARVVELSNDKRPPNLPLGVIVPLGGYSMCLRLLEPGPYGTATESAAVYSLGNGREIDTLRSRYSPGSVASILGSRELEIAISEGVSSELTERDPWRMREEFLELPQRGDKLVSFLNRWGLWDASSMSEIVGGVHRLGTSLIHYAAPELMWERQTFYKAALSGKPKDWLTLHARVPAPQRQLTPPFLATVDTFCSAAIETTITMDKLRDVPYRICAKEDCGRIFRLRTKHDRQFCTHACAHLTAVRRGRSKRMSVKDKGGV